MKRVLITGASDGIGRAIAECLAGNYELILFGRDIKKLADVGEACGGARTFAFDLNDHDARDNVLKQIGDIDVLINNAGVWHKVGDLESISDERIVEVINTNLTSQILLTRALLPRLKKQSSARIINVSSKSGVKFPAGQSVYAASKHGMRAFTDVLREDMKASGSNVKVCGLYQAGTDTDMFSKADDPRDQSSYTKPKDLAHVVKLMIEQPDSLVLDHVEVNYK